MKEGVFYLQIIKEPYRVSAQDQSHYFLCTIGLRRSVKHDTYDILFTTQLNAVEVADLIEISVTAFYKRLNKWGWESNRLYDVKKATTITSKEIIGNEAWRALSDSKREGNLAKIKDSPEIEKRYCCPITRG